jgi:hypothetical protein
LADALIESFSPFPIERFRRKRAKQAAGSPLA